MAKVYKQAVNSNHKELVATLSMHRAMIEKFAKLVHDRRTEDPADDLMIVILRVDDVFGGELARALMPGQEEVWNSIREKGLGPYAIGTVPRWAIQLFLEAAELGVAKTLRDTVAGIAILAVDCGAVGVFEIQEN